MFVGVSFLGTLFWPLNPDAAFVVYLQVRERPLVEAVPLVMLGQVPMLLLLQVLGHRLRAHWPWLDRRCTLVEVRWGRRLAVSGTLVAAASGFAGVPPSSIIVLLASALRLSPWRILPTLLVFRTAWYIALGYATLAIAGAS